MPADIRCFGSNALVAVIYHPFCDGRYNRIYCFNGQSLSFDKELQRVKEFQT